MSYLESHEEATPQQYRMKVMSELLVQAHILGLDVEEFVGFFATTVQTMLSCPPNYNKFGEKARVWILRGFYADTPIFFKITILTNDSSKEPYYVKVSPLRVGFRAKSGATYDAHVTFNSSDINENITDRMENAFLGADHKLNPILRDKLKMPRCMSPKGMPVLNYKKPKKKSNVRHKN